MGQPTEQDPRQDAAASRGGRVARWLGAGGWKAVAGGVAGAAGLAAYSHFIGCRTGSCLLTSDVRTATVLGAVLGTLIGWPAPRTAREARPRR
jgi:hypothetical protein